MKKLVSILLILTTVFCFTACQSKPSKEKIKKAFIGTFIYDEVIWELSSGNPDVKNPGQNKLGVTAFSYNGTEWNDNTKAEITSIDLLTDDERTKLEKLDENQKLKGYKYIYSVRIFVSPSGTQQFYYANGDIFSENNESNKNSVFYLIKLKKV